MSKIINIKNHKKREPIDKIVLFFMENNDELRYVTAQYIKEDLLVKFFHYYKRKKEYENIAYIFFDGQTEKLLQLFNVDKSDLLYELKERFNQFSACTDLVKFTRDNGIGSACFENEFEYPLSHDFDNIVNDYPLLYYADGKYIIHGFYEHPENGVVKIYTPEGFLRYEIPYKNNLINGIAKHYFTNTKQLLLVEKYSNGKLNGHQIAYFKNGNIKLEETFIDGVKEGIEREYKEDGWLWTEIMFSKNKKNGIAKEFFQNGNLKNETLFKNNLQHGYSKWYYETGELEGESTWKNDKCHGAITNYHKNGKIRSTSQCKNGKYYGDEISYYDDGSLKQIMPSIKGMREGNTINYYRNGNIEQITPYHKDKRNGLAIAYYENGKTEVEYNYKNGKKHGICKTYHYSGRVRTIAEYKNDKLHGKKQRYYNNGNISYEHNYKNGLRDGFSVSYKEKTQEIQLKMFFRKGELVDWYGTEGITGVKNLNTEGMD